jgi:hypothetical protein
MPLSKIDSDSLNTPITAADLAYTGTLTGSTGIVNIGSGQVYKDASGNVGIGTASPSTYANGFAPVLVAGTGNNFATVQGRTDGPSGAANGVAYGGSYQSNPINGSRITLNAEGGSGQRGSVSFWTKALDDGSTQPIERARIIQSGTMYLGYGGQAPVLSGADVQGLSLTSASNTLLQIYMIKAAQVEAHFGFKSSTDTNLYVGTGGGIAGIGTYGLYQANTGTTWTSVSDERFKTELQPIENALDKIANVRAVTGRYTYDAENGRTARRSFLIAQDFVMALPEAVDTQDPDKLGLSYSDTIPLLVAAIKELKAIVDAQGAEIAALKGTP